VGATWDDKDMFEKFITGGYWQLGFDDDDSRRGIRHQISRRNQIRPHDLIAIKIRSSLKDTIVIRAVGIVTTIGSADHRVYVDWVESNLQRRVPSNGHFESIRAFPSDLPWTKQVFRMKDRESQDGVVVLPDLDDNALLRPEGKKKYRLHLVKERNKKNVKLKKAQVKKQTGLLLCEACNFDFNDQYGDLGSDFCEVHHTVPLSQLSPSDQTFLDDLAILCSNCHRMIHKTNPMMSVKDFRDQYIRRLWEANGKLAQ
jgi:5-methylcytosine-specific restriction endonuclease McrA